MLRTLVVVLVRIDSWVMVGEPVAEHFLHDLCVCVGVVPICVVEDFAVLEAHFLRAGDALEAACVSIVGLLFVNLGD